MRKDAINLEETRLEGVDTIEDYQIFKERHRVFPAVLDIAAGVGCSSQRIFNMYSKNLVSSDISPTALKILYNMGIPTLAFDIDDNNAAFPFPDGYFDAIVSLVTLEHLLYFDNFLQEIHRILSDHGFLYISTPNYAAPEYMANPILRGKTFHDPFGPVSKYEFFAHVRYFTYETLLDVVRHFGFTPDTVYLALPGGSTRYQNLYSNSKVKALAYRYAMMMKHVLLPARFASEPILCCQKDGESMQKRVRKVVL